MNEKDQKRMLLPGVLMMLGLLLYLGTYFLARGTGQIVRFDIHHLEVHHSGGSYSTKGSVVVAPVSNWIDIENQLLSEIGPSVVLFSSQTMPRILNAVFWPLRKLEMIYRNLLNPAVWMA